MSAVYCIVSVAEVGRVFFVHMPQPASFLPSSFTFNFFCLSQRACRMYSSVRYAYGTDFSLNPFTFCWLQAILQKHPRGKVTTQLWQPPQGKGTVAIRAARSASIHVALPRLSFGFSSPHCRAEGRRLPSACMPNLVLQSLVPSQRGHRVRLWLLLLGASIFALLLFVLNLGRWLVVDDPLHKADAIAVLSGRMPERALEAARVYKQGYATQVWLTHSTEPAAALAELSIPFQGEDFY